MKRIVYLLLLFVFCLPNLAKAEFETKMVVTLSAIDPTKQLGQVPRSLNECVQCQQSGHTFTFSAHLAGETIEIMSGDTVVYTSVIGEDGQLPLPMTSLANTRSCCTQATRCIVRRLNYKNEL